MPHQKVIFFLAFICISPFCSCSQEFGTDNTFNVLISKTYGDLNKDGIDDLVILTQDTVDSYEPYRLEVFFTQKDSTHTLVVSNSKAIIPKHPYGDGSTDGGFDTIIIKKGVLCIKEEFTRGHMEHKFRYQNVRFELIGFSYVNGGSCCIQIIDFNLSTGRRIEKEMYISTDKTKVVSDSIVKLNPLPNLAEFEVLTGEYFF